MPGADLRKAELARDSRDALLMLLVFPAMHEDDRERIETLLAHFL